MTIKIYVRPTDPFAREAEWTVLTFDGPNEDDIAAVSVAHFLMTRYDVAKTDEDGDMVEHEDWEY